MGRMSLALLLLLAGPLNLTCETSCVGAAWPARPCFLPMTGECTCTALDTNPPALLPPFGTYSIRLCTFAISWHFGCMLIAVDVCFLRGPACSQSHACRSTGSDKVSAPYSVRSSIKGHEVTRPQALQSDQYQRPRGSQQQPMQSALPSKPWSI